MSVMNPAMEAALGGFTPTIFGAIEIVLPSHTIRLLDGSAVISFDGKIFSGRDATYGVIQSIDDLTDGTGDEAPALRLTLIPASDAAAADIAAASMQGAKVTIWMGVVDPATGVVVGEPLMIFLGALDTVTLKAGANTRTLEMEITSAFEWFFFNDDGARLSDTFHQYLWPGETGLASVDGVLHQVYWGSKPVSGVSR